MKKPHLVLGLSGGVDSAVSALLLRESYQVYCLWLDIGLGGGEDAAAMADWLGLPFEKKDIRRELEHFVCQPFVEDYLAGRTPLPCARCNPLVKFPALLQKAEELGGGYVATGHYARVTQGPEGRILLRKGQPANDQSYMLGRLTQSILRRTVFPLGGYEKVQVRALAAQRGVPVAHKPDSMEICFIPGGNYAAWLDALGGVVKRVPVTDEDSNVVDHVLVPVVGGKIEGGAPDKVFYFRCPDDALRGYRIFAGDLLLCVPAQKVEDGAISLFLLSGRRVARKANKLDGNRVHLQSYDREFTSQTLPAAEARVLAKCVKLERRL